MPGNTTQVKSPRQFFPPEWIKSSIPAGQTTGVPMEIVGVPLINSMPMPRPGSIVSVGLVLSQAVTNQFIRFEITKNGSGTGKTKDMSSAEGTKQIWEFEPGVLPFSKGDELGFNWGSHPAMAPSGIIEALIVVEVQFD